MLKVESPPTVADVQVRGVVLVRCGKTGRPKFERPMHEYPYWAQIEFHKILTPTERAEFW